MRVVILALLFLPVSLTGEAFGAFRCIETDEVVKIAPQPAPQQNQSSFRGIGLASRPVDVQWRAQSPGFVTQTSHYIGDTAIAAVDICAQGEAVGRADFDRQAKMVRLSLEESSFQIHQSSCAGLPTTCSNATKSSPAKSMMTSAFRTSPASGAFQNMASIS
jgi:hypothetical protein